MKTKTILLFLLVLLPLYTSGQSSKDESAILIACLGQSEIQQIIGPSDRIIVMQHGVSFSFESEILVSEIPVIFLPKSEVNSQGVSSFVVFWRFEINENKSLVEFVYQITDSESLFCEITLIKTDEGWNISNKKMERR